MAGRVVLRDAWKDTVICDGVTVAVKGGFRGFHSVPIGSHSCVNHGANLDFDITKDGDVVVAILEGDAFRTTIESVDDADFPYHAMARGGRMDKKMMPWPADTEAAAAAADDAAEIPSWMEGMPPEMVATMMAIEAAKAKVSTATVNEDIARLNAAALDFATTGSDDAATAWGTILHACKKSDREMAAMPTFYAPFSEAVCEHIATSPGLVRGRAAQDLRYLAEDLGDAAGDVEGDDENAARMRSAGERMSAAL
jgi:hypothetical protein|tara:strand:+ start:74 stop:835 length:762 start_codon:yes stop_codon:yes gene_type:complete